MFLRFHEYKIKKKESYLKYLRYLIGNAICCSFEIAQMTYVRFYTGKLISCKIKKKNGGKIKNFCED